ncbi:PREDICTED: EF-hand calcium-binding domain-containing protein 11 [Cariama cristata]|uniref:EF-hand calcium-binding domain-containing protein 11 n=1 Tax=Cariama cristata TaxID=54380 RepID=UPI0005209D9C|nr:PREDICTED: EF-hand calcium-binding domain-containing protein 11 [Cariama cristata]
MQITFFRYVFEACEDNRGYLGREEFKVAVVMLFGYKPSKEARPHRMSSVFPDPTPYPHVRTLVGRHLVLNKMPTGEHPDIQSLLFEKFLNLMSAKKATQLYSNETRQIFTAFDVQDRGFLTSEHFKRAFNSVSPELSEKIIVEDFR